MCVMRITKTSFVLFAGVFLASGCLAASPRDVLAADVTVCDSGCDYTTIFDAITGGGFSSGDTIYVQSPYSSSTESFTLFPPANVNLTCLDSGVIIGTDTGGPNYILPQGGNTIQDCHFNHVLIQMDFPNTVVQNNDLMGTSQFTGLNTSDLTVQDNTGIFSMGFNGIQTMLITGNGFDTIGPEFGGISFQNSTSIQITRNDIVDTVTSTNTNYSLIRFGGNSYDIYFASNTLSTPYATYYGGGSSRIEISSSKQIVLRDNLFSFSGNGSGVQVLNFNGSSGDIAIDAQHNTIKLNDPCENCAGILMNSWNVSDVSVTSVYNLIVATTPSSTANMQAHSSYGAGPSSNLHLFTDYEGFANLNVTGTTDFPAASNSITLYHDPFKIHDATSSNDFELVPYSAFLDVNGTLDIGGKAGVRGNSFHVDAAGTIDYVSVDATNTSAVAESLRPGDTVHIAAGNYSPLQLIQRAAWPIPLTGDISILGSGSSTVIEATSTGSALFANGVSTSTFKNLTFAGATGMTVTTNYTMTHTLFHFGGVDYDQTSGITGTPDQMFVIGNVSCSANLVSSDGFDITSSVGSAADDWNVALLDLFGNKVTVWLPNNVVTSSAALAVFIAGPCGSSGTIDLFMNSVIKANGDGTFSYDSSVVSGAGASVKSGETLPPAITRVQTFGTNAGIRLQDSSSNRFTNVTSSNNPFGVIFSGTSANNDLVNSELFSNFGYDVLGQSSGNNFFSDTSFSRVSSTFTNGSLTARYSVRAFAQNTGLQAISGATITFLAANNATSSAVVTDAAGFTPLTLLPAFTISSSTNSLASGGYNPYSVTAGAFGSYLSAVTSLSVSSTGQSVSLTMVDSGSSSGSGGGGGGGGGIPLQIPPSGFSTSTTTLGSSVDSGISLRLSMLSTLGMSVHDLVKLKDDGNPKTQEDSTVYYLGADGRRHAFPHFSVYFTWYCDYKNVKIISPADLALIPLGKNVTYRPGVRLVKFVTLPTVYVVQTGGVLRAIPDEATAVMLAGSNWAKSVHDINDAFYLDYQIGEPLESIIGMNFDQSPTYPSGSMNIAGYADPGVVSGWLTCAAQTLTSFRFTGELKPYSQEVSSIKRLQALLNIPVTGYYGAETIQAVRNFQAKNGIRQTGIVGPETGAKLNALLDAM